jgi:hypothetical protein
VTAPLRFDFPDGGVASAVEVTDSDELPRALATLGLTPPRPTVVIVGGAGGLDEVGMGRLHPIFTSVVMPILERSAAVAVDGGTDSGVMRMSGEARSTLGAAFPLVGVVAAGTVQLPGRPAPPNTDTVLEPHHTHFLIVPGDEWGAEAPWIADTATVLAAGGPSVTLLINGGQIAYTDLERSVAAGRPVIVIAGSGRTADAIADALDGINQEDRAQALAQSGLVRAVSIDEPEGVADVLAAALCEKPPIA